MTVELVTPAQAQMNRMYDGVLLSRNYRMLYEGSGYFNFGYWGADAKTQQEACDALIDRLVGRIAVKGGRILDVACGPGGSTHRLLTNGYAPENITAINISEAQLNEARALSPGCSFLLMDATRLKFPDNHFDAVMCVESAVNFDTRDQFFHEAFRVLKPGGSLVLSDMIFRNAMRPVARLLHVPRANFVKDPEDYGEGLKAAGFTGVTLEDATQTCLVPFRQHLKGWPKSERRRGRIGLGYRLSASALMSGIATYLAVACKTYVIASARKPLTSQSEHGLKGFDVPGSSREGQESARMQASLQQHARPHIPA